MNLSKKVFASSLAACLFMATSCIDPDSGNYAECNGKTYDSANEFCYKGNIGKRCNGTERPRKLSHARFLGNSLLLGNTNFGMNATSKDKDYFHYLDSAFRAANPDYEAMRLSAKSMENMTSTDSQMTELSREILPFLDETTDLVSIQLGDNVKGKKEKLIFDKFVFNTYDAVCRAAPNATVIWIGEWYSSDYKQEILEGLSRKAGAIFVDISDLNRPIYRSEISTVITYDHTIESSSPYKSYEVRGDTLEIHSGKNAQSDGDIDAEITVESYQVDSIAKIIYWTGYQDITFTDAVASHPNDRAFKLIADRVLQAIGPEFDGI